MTTIRYLPAADIFNTDDMADVFNSALQVMQRTHGQYFWKTPDVAIQDFRDQVGDETPVNLYRITVEKVETTQ